MVATVMRKLKALTICLGVCARLVCVEEGRRRGGR